MRTIGEDLRSWVLGSPEVSAIVGDRMHRMHVPQEEYAGPYIWYRRSASADERALDDAPGEEPFDIFFDVECISEDIGEADDLSEIVRRLSPAVNPAPFGNGTAQVVYFQDHAEDYEPRGVNSDDGRYASALECHIQGYQPGA